MKSTFRRFHSVVLSLVLLALIVLVGTGQSALRPTQAHASSSFVTRNGSQLQLDGSTFRFSGSDMEWLGEPGQTNFEVDDALATLKEMGGTVTRSLWLTSLGTPDSLQPSLGVYNSDAFARSDYVIKRAGDFGVRLIIPLVDGNPNGDGQYTHYTDWRGISDANQFYTNSTVISDYEAFISAYLNHVNIYTGIALKNDPTILAWETANELTTPQSWTQTISSYIKGIDTNHLVGSSPVANEINSSDLSISSIDIEDDHFYPMSVANLNSHASTVQNAGKVYIAGEYDWAAYTSGSDSLTSFLPALEGNSAVSGDMAWELFPHRNTYGFEPYNAGSLGLALGLHYPGDTTDMRTNAQRLRTHAFAMAGISTLPAHLVPGTPVMMQVAGQKLYWRGTAGVDTYSVERSTSSASGPWTTICTQCTTDAAAPYVDASQPASGQIWYRVLPYSLDGVAGSYSQAMQARGDVVVGNNSFESPALSAGTFQVAPSSASWTFTGSAGIATNGSAFTNGNPSAPDGGQVAFLQSNGSISIPVTLQTNTGYCLTFQAAQRGNYNNGGQDFKVQFDGQAVVGSYKPDGSQYDVFISSYIMVQTASHTLQFVGLDSAGGDNTAFIDSIRMVTC
ncbi:hypothetical protein [Tengunoibacter tsumagoiensis]|uniref:mannan endo-1,4-beta-mannosidase n=1 Tax=Tengunoibacter tsumagoiensis TaxID=2014871 RepID=A0A402A706_9CHLR|nr:hypothetical protein [Tengunoibacter tsumagoiensis]GCE14888.1 hypothetical protein KTT_47470 [Tengunoibacter tsumagoiensis]